MLKQDKHASEQLRLCVSAECERIQRQALLLIYNRHNKSVVSNATVC
jgi:hypothetical protein